MDFSLNLENKRRLGIALSAGLCALILLAGPACKKERRPGETPAQRAKRELLESLFIPPDSKLLEEKVYEDMDTLVFRFGTNEPAELVQEFLRKKMVENRLVSTILEDNMASYVDQKGRKITMTWSAKDPVFWDYKTFLYVAVYPIPKEMKKK